MVYNYKDKSPKIDKSTFIAESADVIGDVTIEKNVSIWFGAVLRGDSNIICVGENTNIQDNTVVHVDSGKYPTIIGNNITIGHNAIIHGCKINDNVLIGMGTIILNGAEIGKNTIVGAGSLVTQNKKIPEGVLCLGSPAKVVRKLTQEEIKSIQESVDHYVKLSKEYLIIGNSTFAGEKQPLR
ncbi:gamma carbonic anhydrase family protein [Haloimpatiens sp. FM7330]|uniref:gamma carbonic anhydrase family protein n=1 Tax=Haloimpatiens sp. FM7330 TaxID=3298610 RepID=UPI00364453CD